LRCTEGANGREIDGRSTREIHGRCTGGNNRCNTRGNSPTPAPSIPRQFGPETVLETILETVRDFAPEITLDLVPLTVLRIGGLKIAAYDIEASFYPKFRVSTGCIHLALGALQRGLGNVTEKSPHTYTDWTGRQRETVEHLVRRMRRS
jgi:hypothetical protein